MDDNQSRNDVQSDNYFLFIKILNLLHNYYHKWVLISSEEVELPIEDLELLNLATAISRALLMYRIVYIALLFPATKN
jgi:hypothetical protein